MRMSDIEDINNDNENFKLVQAEVRHSQVEENKIYEAEIEFQNAFFNYRNDH